MPSRRRILAGFGAVSIAGFAGCGSVLRPTTRVGEGDTIEVIVVNETDEVAQIGVRVENDDGEALFSHVYRLEPGQTDQSAGIETTPTVIHAFSATGPAASWEYTPDSDLNCDGQDVGIALTADATIESWYGC